MDPIMTTPSSDCHAAVMSLGGGPFRTLDGTEKGPHRLFSCIAGVG
jgi:hypothetical protein